jgi:hypothetical protein
MGSTAFIPVSISAKGYVIFSLDSIALLCGLPETDCMLLSPKQVGHPGVMHVL